MSDVDVLVIGGGNAGACAALSAAETGARTLLIERTAEVLVEEPAAPSSAAIGLAEEERVRLEILLAELLQLKARLRGVRF